MTEQFLFARNKHSADSLIGMKDIAAITGLSYWYVRALNCGNEKSSVPFPEPVTRIGRRPLWRRIDIVDWHSKR